MSGKETQPHQLSHRRYNPLNGTWLLVSPGRHQRPWLGEAQDNRRTITTPYDPDCFLCPGNTRISGQQNPAYEGPYVFPSDTPSLAKDSDPAIEQDSLFHTAPAIGCNRVVCYSQQHDLTLAQLPREAVLQVIHCWASQSQELGREHSYVQIFENKGAMMGCSNPHPHSQIWASHFVPQEVQREDDHQRRFMAENGKSLLLATAQKEAQLQERVLIDSDHWLVIVPFWALWPYETLVLPKAPCAYIEQLDGEQRQDLAQTLKNLLMAYDRLFDTTFPYSMGWHGAPYREGDQSHWQLHAHFYPPLLRSATVKKHMVGYEMLAEPGRDFTPEQACQELRRHL